MIFSSILYIHHYSVEGKDWLKCGITNKPVDRLRDLRSSAKKFNIDVSQIEIYKFDDGFNASNCEKELMNRDNLRFVSIFDVEGKTEFFKYESLEEIKKIIFDWV